MRIHSPSQSLDAVVYSVEQFRDWIYSSSKGELCLYHSGQMLLDQEGRPQLKRLGDYAALMSDFGVIIINQLRKQEGLAHYLARRTAYRSNSIPKLVGTGLVEVPCFISLRAVESRDAHQSVRRAIRDVLSCGETEAAHMFAQLLKMGYIREGRPPEITPSGARVLI